MKRFTILPLLIGCSEFSLNAIADQQPIEPQILVNPLRIDFGELFEGEQASETIRIQNTGSAALEITQLMLVAENTAFSIPRVTNTDEVDAIAFPVELAPADDPDGRDMIEFDVVYTTDNLYDEGIIEVISSDPDEGTIEIDLSGGVVGPHLQIEPATFDFSEKRLDCDDTTVFTLRNIGNETLLIDAVYLGEETLQISKMPQTDALEPGETAEVAVFFKPTVAGDVEDLLTVLSNDPAGDKSAPIQATGVDDGSCQPEVLDLEIQYQIADISFIVDTTCSMSALATELLDDFSEIADELDDTIDDITFGVASFRDYAYFGYGSLSADDLPFQLEIQQTSDITSVTDALGGLVIAGGSDSPESGIEALYQAATGLGYDQNCDQRLDSATDVPPFLARPDDVYAGSVAGTGSAAEDAVGTVGGMGFRAEGLPILIIGTDNYLRDPSDGYGSPGGCTDATAAMATAALDAINARVIGVGVGWTPTSNPYTQMESVADLTVTWQRGAPNFTETIVKAVNTLIGDVQFDRVWLEISHDPYNQIDAVQPNEWENIRSGEQVQFTIHTTANSPIMYTATSETTEVQLDLYGQIGDQSTLLSREVLYVLSPGE